MPKFQYRLKTMGCKANIYDSLVIERELEELGGVRAPSDAEANLFIMNSCTVTAEADRQALRDVTVQRTIAPESFTVMTGCLAEVGADKLKSNSSIDAIVGNTQKHTLRKVVAQRFGISEQPVIDDDQNLYWGSLPAHSDKTRAFIKIQEGCNDFCTYCIIPYARGASRSVAQSKIISEIRRLSILGIQEFVLTGTNIADYGNEFGSTFDDLVENILTEVPGLNRLRLSSLDPTEITPRLLEMMKSEMRLMPHFHVSLQSAVSRVLRAMKRHYRSEEVIKALWSIYNVSSDIFVGMDLIAGFPSETKEEHEQGLAMLKDLPWARLHVFPYSPREGTPALKIPGLEPMDERKRRARELMNLSSQRHEKFVSRYLGKHVDRVLLEKPFAAGLDTVMVGHMPNYTRVAIKVSDMIQAQKLQNQEVTVKVETMIPKPAQDWTLEGFLG